MEPPRGLWASLWSFVCFLPFFLGLLLLGILKGAILSPITCIVMTAGNSAVILGLWPLHFFWTNYSIARSKMLGPILKLVLCLSGSCVLFLWPFAAIIGSVVSGMGYGFFSPLMATFEAVGEGREDKFRHCITDGTWATIQGSFTVVRDLLDVCFHSYLSLMDDLRNRSPPDGHCCEISVFYLTGSIMVGLTGMAADFLGVSMTALCKTPYMLFKGWRRLFHDLIGREGPFLETACVPFAGLAIILWPAAVFGALVASVLSSFPLGGYAGVVTYQEKSVRMGLRYIVSSLSMYDEYSNDILDLPEGSCFPRLRYRNKEQDPSVSLSRRGSILRRTSVKSPPDRSVSFKNSILELNPLKLLEHLFAECETYGTKLVEQGVITATDVKEISKSGMLRVGLPAYVILRALLKSIKLDSDGIVLGDNTEITTANKPKDTFFDWFFEPVLIMKQQIRAENLSYEEEEYLCKLVLLSGDVIRIKELNARSLVAMEERRRAELDAIARRLQGITKSASRYPTFRRQFDGLVKSLSEKLEGRINSGSQATSPNGLPHLLSPHTIV